MVNQESNYDQNPKQQSIRRNIILIQLGLQEMNMKKSKSFLIYYLKSKSINTQNDWKLKQWCQDRAGAS